MKVMVIEISLEEYLNKTESYLGNIIIDPQNPDTWKFQLTIAINFISSKDVEEERVMQSRSNKINPTSYKTINKVVNKLFDSIRLRYQGNLEKLMRGSDSSFDSVQLMYYKCHKVNFRGASSNIDSPDWLKTKKTKKQ